MVLDQYEESAALQADSAGSYEPDVITTGYLSLIVDDPSASADEVSQLVLDAGGRIASRSDYSPTDYGSPSSYLELRVPYDSVETTLAAISDRGIVQESSLNSVYQIHPLLLFVDPFSDLHSKLLYIILKYS